MEKKYFGNCKTAEEAKATFVQKMKELRGSNSFSATETFEELKKEFSATWMQVGNWHQNHKTGVLFKDDNVLNEDDAISFMNEIDTRLIALFEMSGITIEILGRWIYVSGNTKPYKDRLGKGGKGVAGLGFKWNNQKGVWVYNPDPQKRVYHKYDSMDEIRRDFDGSVFKTDDEN